ncbi:MAG: zf-TFIIB domain-containing protein [Chloroflexota bacterium]|nr:zf-TFIIB domain-containing protein [Chloroflexota bacterium]
MKCPSCTTDLALGERQGLEIDYCPNCRGVWLDRGKLDKIIERSASPAPHTQQQPTYNQGNQGYNQNQGYQQRPYRDHDDDDDDDHDDRFGGDGKKRKRGGFLGDLFG